MYNKLAIVASFIMYISFSIALRSPLTRLPTATLHQNGCDNVLAAPFSVITSAPEIIQDVSSNDTTEESISDASSAVGESLDTKGNTDSAGSKGEFDYASGDDSAGDRESGTSDSKDADKAESKRNN